MLKDLIRQNRSTRRFDQSHAVDTGTLKELVELARFSASGSNLQPLKFILCNDPETNAAIFDRLSWAGYLANWNGPAEGERPAAYIVILGDTAIKSGADTDKGIAAQSMMLGATEQGLGGCMIGSIDDDGLRVDLDIDSQYEILLVRALGKPAETVVLETVGADGDIKYWRDNDGVHHVPKRTPDDLIVDVIEG
jgi:nitroreductase